MNIGFQLNVTLFCSSLSEILQVIGIKNYKTSCKGMSQVTKCIWAKYVTSHSRQFTEYQIASFSKSSIQQANISLFINKWNFIALSINKEIQLVSLTPEKWFRQHCRWVSIGWDELHVFRIIVGGLKWSEKSVAFNCYF